MSDPKWTLNGYDLDTALGCVLLDGTTWHTDNSVRDTSVIVPGAHGIVTSDYLPTFEAGHVNLELEWNVGSQSELEAKVNHVRALFMYPNLTLERSSGGVTVSARVRFQSISHSDFLAGSHVRALIVLSVPKVFFRGAIEESAAMTIGASSTLEIPHLSGSTAPIVDPVLRIAGPATFIGVYDLTTGTGITWNGSMSAGQYLFLCPSPLSARISSSPTAWYSGGIDQTSMVSWPAAGRLQLWPMVQTPTVRKVLVDAYSASGASTTKLTVRASGSYL